MQLFYVLIFWMVLAMTKATTTAVKAHGCFRQPKSSLPNRVITNFVKFAKLSDDNDDDGNESGDGAVDVASVLSIFHKFNSKQRTLKTMLWQARFSMLKMV